MCLGGRTFEVSLWRLDWARRSEHNDTTFMVPCIRPDVPNRLRGARWWYQMGALHVFRTVADTNANVLRFLMDENILTAKMQLKRTVYYAKASEEFVRMADQLATRTVKLVPWLLVSVRSSLSTSCRSCVVTVV